MIHLPEDVWDPWSPDDLSARLGRSDLCWYVVGGWALDLWHGHLTREHEDLEFAVIPDDADHCREQLGSLEFFIVHEGSFTHLPSTAELPLDVWQIWGADMAAEVWRVDMMIERGTRELWVCKRDPEIRLPREDAIRKSAAGIPHLAPALVLLFKAKHCRQKDERDFRAALPKLKRDEKADLRRWLEALHPNHQWIASLSTDCASGSLGRGEPQAWA